MKRILLYLDKNQFENYDYSVNYETAMSMLGENSGNSVFQYALQTLLTDEKVNFTINTDLFKNIFHDEKYFDEINANYDCIVCSPANIISEHALKTSLAIAKNVFSKINLPVYAIGLGAQSTFDYSFDFLSSIKRECYETFKLLLDKGGRIGLRGFFTADCLTKIGFSKKDFSVIGCPSLFLKGPGLKIEKQEVSENEFRPLINGFRAWNNKEFHKYFCKYEKSIFVDQEEFYRLLYLPEKLTWKERQYLIDDYFINLYRQERIKPYGNFQSWYTELISKKINFSLGCRIHGNIVPLLAGIPCLIDIFDSRVRELSEFFNIPGKLLSYDKDPFEYYQLIDYSKFNQNYPLLYENFRKFMVDLELPCNYAKNICSMKLPEISSINKIILESERTKPNLYSIMLSKINDLNNYIQTLDKRINQMDKHISDIDEHLKNVDESFCEFKSNHKQ